MSKQFLQIKNQTEISWANSITTDTTSIVWWTWSIFHMKYIARMSQTIFMCCRKKHLVLLPCNSYEVHMKFTWSSNHSKFIWTSCELFMRFMSTSLVLHGYNILTSLVLRYEVHMNFIMNFIRTACKFIWINLISFHMKFMGSAFELHTKFIWTSREFCVKFELHMNFIWSSYEVNNKFLCSSNKFHMKLWIYGFIWTLYKWASGSIVVLP